jgi:tRNA G18 (ribose-2'-O)-methylase SpoU
VEGYRSIKQIVGIAPALVSEVVYDHDMPDLDNIDYPVRRLTASQFRAIALSLHPAGPVAVVTLPPGWDSFTLPGERGKKVLVLEDIQDPGNVGSLIRSAAAFDFSGIILSQKCADPFAPKATQASCGAVVSPWLRRTDRYRDLIRQLKEDGFQILAADLGGKPWKHSGPAQKGVALMLGNEGNGLTSETLRLADEIVKIPINEKNVESLNVAACGAICMYQASSQRDAGPTVPF